MQLTKGKIVTITSVKGGVGKTTFLLTLAATYKKENKKILIIDMDIFSGDIEAILNVSSKRDVYTLFEDMVNNNFYEIENYITKYDDNIDFIAAPKDPRYASKINGRFLNLLFNRVVSKYDVILVDTNHFLNEINLVTFDHSNQIVYIMNNNPMNLKNMKTMISIFEDMNMSDYKIVLYEATSRKSVFRKFDIKAIIKDDINYIVPSDFYIKDIDKYILNSNFIESSNKYLKSGNLRLFEKIAKDLIK